MKLEPVAWQFRFKAKLAEWRGCSSGDALLYGNMAEYETRELYAIPEGYVVVPVLLLKRASAAMMEWAAKYGEHNPQWLPPARVAELSAEIEAMIAAKEQS